MYPTTRTVWHHGIAILDANWFHEDAASTVQIVEPLADGGDTEQMGAELGEDMARHRETSRFGERGGTQPATHPADLHHIEHNVVGSMGRDTPGHVVRPPPVLPKLNGRAGSFGDPRMDDPNGQAGRTVHDR